MTPRPRKTAHAAAVLLAACAFAAALGLQLRPSTVEAAPAPVTWRHQIGPLVYKNCSSCHHPGGSAPFSLMSYKEALRWGSLMPGVTQSRYMPPWLPTPGYGHFAGDRHLSNDDIALIAAWVKAGMPEGDGPAPTPPVYSSDWALGPPDLILEMPATEPIPASGTDIYRNFILPVPITTTHWVRAMEIKPGSSQVTHHANVLIDRTASLRHSHPADWQHGIPGMDILLDSGDRFDPDSHFLFWKPDSTALVEPPGMPWRLDPGNDLVLNMHLKPTGKPETVRARIGLYFTPQPATAHPMLLQLEDDAALDIPPGDPDFVIQDQLRLPVAVEVLGVYPHAHYLGKRLEAWAILPNGEKQWLILIKDWDIDRQSVYRLATPLFLPKGSVLHMRYTYDNSSANIRNPNSPPLRVRAGNRAVDEMGHFWVQVLPIPDPNGANSAEKSADSTEKVADSAEKPDPRLLLEQAWMENRLRKNPTDELSLYNLASALQQEGNTAAAEAIYKKLLLLHPDDARTLTSLGSAFALAGNTTAAQTQYRVALAKDPTDTDAAFDLATLDLRLSNANSDAAAEAVTLFTTLAQSHPNDPDIQTGLGAALLANNNLPAARDAFNQALALAPDGYDALLGLGQLALQTGDLASAQSSFEQALHTRDTADAHRLLALALAGEGDLPKALDQLLAWQHLAPNDLEPHRALAQVYAQLGRFPEALREQHLVLAHDPTQANDWNDLGALEARSGDKPAARRDLQHALTLDPANQAALRNLRHLQ